MPGWLLRAFEEGRSKIEANETLESVNIVGVGSGNMKKSNRDRIIKRWKKAARGGVSNVQKPGLKAVAAMFGIPVIEEKSDG